MSSIWKYKYFVDVIESKSFTKAGNMNYVSQTAISQNISSLQMQRAEGGGETAGEGL
ncbi:LysR family transcriptional regulator [Faecalicatena contorta]|uniref:helix-turn-helix domain-containing protein n=1 Tax=Clostridia TaxID=186801 RepID=UPI000A981C69|nr:MULTISPECIES: LysR family transcriptional regulator [Clostridia]MBM6684520.1 LysR family transcriptional regulator [Faecalicatena contorta]MBM6709167.1 LysR family transcriptional regulator [Faecalicatena contorta]